MAVNYLCLAQNGDQTWYEPRHRLGSPFMPNRAVLRSIRLTKQVCDRGPVRYQADRALEHIAHLNAIINTECLADPCEKVGWYCGIVCRLGVPKKHGGCRK